MAPSLHLLLETELKMATNSMPVFSQMMVSISPLLDSGLVLFFNLFLKIYFNLHACKVCTCMYLVRKEVRRGFGEFREGRKERL